MEKKLISLAVAALASTGAMAQVTFYGVLDAGVFRTSGEQATGSDLTFTGVTGGNLSGNRLGLAVEEDLGGGMKAVGRFEFGSLRIDDTSDDLVNDAGNGINNTRQSYVGVAFDSIGSFIVGRLQGPGYDIGVKHDPLGSAIFGPFAMLANGAAGSRTITTGGQNSRVNNGFEYISPKLAGAVTIKALAARTNPDGELSTTPADADVYGIGAEYSAGPLEVSGVYEFIDQISVVGPDTADHWDALIGVNYNFGAAKLFASYLWNKRENPIGNEIKGKFYQLGVHFPLGAGTIKAAVGHGDTDHVSAIDASDPDAATSFAIDYEHEFGKRTTGWVGLNYTRVGGQTGVTLTGVSASVDNDIQGIGAGLRLKF
jgi:predicted porin